MTTYHFAADTAQHAARLTSEGTEFFLVSNQALKFRLDTQPFGVDLHWIDALGANDISWSVLDFLKLYNLINGLSFGERDLAMPHWVMVDLALVPSAIVIAAWSKEQVLEELQRDHYIDDAREGFADVLAAVEANGYDGPIPIAAYCAAPSIEPLRYVGWSLWSFITGHHLATTVKGLALGVYQAEVIDGVTQFDNASLRIHTKFGPLKLRSARLSIHTAANSFVYETAIGGFDHVATEPTFWLDAHDTDRQVLMQKSIEAGESDYFVIAPGIAYEQGVPRVPIVEIPRKEA